MFCPRRRPPSILRLGRAFLSALLFAAACTPAEPSLGCGVATPGTAAPTCSYRIVQRYPHDPGAFTQGLAFHAGELYEGTGLRGESSLRRVDLESGLVLDIHAMSPQFFGEGITVLDDRIMQLTLSSGVGFIYTVDDLDPAGSFLFTPEGWGLTQDGELLIMSDGTDVLRFLDPLSFEVVRLLPVTDAGQPVQLLNELEFVRGEVLANLWLTDRVARISPHTGEVLAWIDLGGLFGEEEPPGVLNGIAYDPGEDRLFVTGKRWPWLFEIELVPPQ